MASKLRVEHSGDEITFYENSKRLSDRKASDQDMGTFTTWIDSYNQALKQTGNQEILLRIGRDILTWLDKLKASIENANPPLIIEFQTRKSASAMQRAFIEVPWELLANDKGHLARNPELKYSPVRRIGAENPSKSEPHKNRLSTLFMAASPRDGQSVLAYEAEESAILNLHADQSLDMDLFVEESGNLSQLTSLATALKPVDVVQLSCHGNIDSSNEDSPEPFLCLENNTGDFAGINGDVFDRTFSQNRPRLIFLSACKTAETFTAKDPEQNREHNSFAQTIIRRGFPAVLGWSSSVSDFEATRFAGAFYRNLSMKSTVEDAVANARYVLFLPPDEQRESYESNDWHLARLYLGTDGGGIFSDGNNTRFDLEKEAGVKEFLDKKGEKVPVANRREFVGRRRQIQDILKEFSDKNHAGVLILGLGNQGKSSLAARVANRMFKFETVVIYGEKGDERMYLPYHILNEFKTVAGIKGETETLIEQLMLQVDANPAALKACLKQLLEGPFSGKDEQHKPVLVVIDDLEKILLEPTNETALYAKYKDALQGIIKAFKEAKTDSRLLLTSRYDFDLFDENGKDVGNLLLKQPLRQMNNTEAKKQYFAKYGTLEREKGDIKLEPGRVVDACKGNPGLQDILFGLFNTAPATYEKALLGMENYLQSGVLPEEQETLDFLQDLAIDNVLSLLTPGEKDLLQVAALFDIPVPDNLFDNLAKEIGLKTGPDFKKRLIGFGVFEQFEDPVLPEGLALLLNNLIKPRIEKLPQEKATYFSADITKALLQNWCSDESKPRPWLCDREIVKFGLLAKHSEAIKQCAENGLRGMHDNFWTKEAAVFAVPAIALLEDEKETVPTGLYRIASDVCHQVGEVNIAKDYIEKSLAGNTDDRFKTASSWLRLGRILVQKGDVDNALKRFAEAKDLFTKLKANRDTAIVLGDIARIKLDKGEVEEALKLHHEVYDICDNLGDAKGKAVTLGDIARIKRSKGEVEEALKLHQARKQVNSELGDLDGIAATLYDMSQIYLQKEDFQKAYDCLAESYQIMLKLGRLDGICHVGRDLGTLLCRANQKEEGLKLLQRALQGFEKLGQKENALQVEEIINHFEKST